MLNTARKQHRTNNKRFNVRTSCKSCSHTVWLSLVKWVPTGNGRTWMLNSFSAWWFRPLIPSTLALLEFPRDNTEAFNFLAMMTWFGRLSIGGTLEEWNWTLNSSHLLGASVAAEEVDFPEAIMYDSQKRNYKAAQHQFGQRCWGD